MSAETIIISPKVAQWLRACKSSFGDDASRDLIESFISGTAPFTRQWYYSMPIRPDFIAPDGTVVFRSVIMRPSIEEELKAMDSGYTQ